MNKSITLHTEENFKNTQIMRMIIFHVFLAAESESDISFSPTRLDFAAYDYEVYF